ncbi:hypothetical protein F8M41_006419 [Gigaspora margarita]|uniref:Uncharacterized protein n=1 Tax=Gigaspora margarita TaxID=4874 RepID=A0A8H4ERI2_GIGMA|nr:hypothetical protein F8M41_006419 [Gigaspora margarita]
MPSKVIAEGVEVQECLFFSQAQKTKYSNQFRFTYFLASSDLSQEGGNLAERASIRELEWQDLEKLTVFSTDSFTTTSLHVPFPEDLILQF